MEEVIDSPFPVLGIAAWSGTGKTTLLAQLLPRLREAGLRVGVIKHAHHSFDVDQPGKDSYKLRQAGAAPMLIASRERFAMMQETPDQEEPDLVYLLSLMTTQAPDLVIVEGFKAWPIPKLVLYRAGIGDDSIVSGDWVQAVASSGPPPQSIHPTAKHLDLNNIKAITEWIMEWMNAQPNAVLNKLAASTHL
ncbi:molybdopterin-guanine dinucleotide biosynthesis protein B [Halomonas sp. TD01]|uniref:molybdopterin-guanine dinucleotide biosynthesis protein B n=1 Tax=Halomonas sp. TD01 TaxID=999141 RepID=UPI000214EF9A|nr:molybdopterin-guanine dinucleotide biosynthesis protein B [Halomonas sp. TD01]EGP19559.1 molybdopterin-guanine dinucleotide biosynthesis protein MobB [Halomonas sp. TD01]CAH1044839.1 Molybdopterin-guanine dinucleotide biosynthesis protein MobB [Halomonas sp. TD01]